MDDFSVFGNSFQEALKNLENFLFRCQGALKILEKVLFHCQESHLALSEKM